MIVLTKLQILIQRSVQFHKYIHRQLYRQYSVYTTPRLHRRFTPLIYSARKYICTYRTTNPRSHVHFCLATHPTLSFPSFFLLGLYVYLNSALQRRISSPLQMLSILPSVVVLKIYNNHPQLMLSF